MLPIIMYENCLDIISRIENLKSQFDKNYIINSEKKLVKKNLKKNKYNHEGFYKLTSNSWGADEKKILIDLFEKNQLTMGSNVKKFEKLFSKYIGSKYSIMVNSGSSANLLIVASLVLNKKFDLKPGDEVIVPSVGWSTSYFPFQQYGLKLRFVDINIDTLNIEYKRISKAITPKTKAILAVNILGNPNELEKINNICKKNNLILIEDNCESLGAKINNKYTGTYGIACSNSFYFSHHIQTIEGGMISTDDKSLYEYMISMRAHGWTRDLNHSNSLEKKSGYKFKDSFRFVLPGYNLRPNEINGVLGCIQLSKFEDFLCQRRKNAKFFIKLFKNSTFCQIQRSIGEPSWFGFSIILKGNLENKRSYVLNELLKFGIETRPIVSGNFLQNPVIKFFDYSIYGNLVNSEKIDRDGFFIGNDQRDLSEQLVKVKSILNSLNSKLI